MGIFSVRGTIAEEEKDKKDKEYRDYIDSHRAMVMNSFDELKDELKKELSLSEYEMIVLHNSVIHHDESKYSDIEFSEYRKYFYPVNDEEKPKELNDAAWHHHIMNNNHHWNYWCYVDKTDKIKAVDIPDINLAELILDWDAMGMIKGDNPLEYYKNNKDKIVLSDNTRLKLEKILKNIYLK